MKKNVVLKRIFHHDKWCIGIFFDFDENLKQVVRSIPGSVFSITNRCFYVEDSEENLKLVLKALKDAAIVDISFLVDRKEISQKTGDKTAIRENKSSSPDEAVPCSGESHETCRKRTIEAVSRTREENNERYYPYRDVNFGPVEFRISEKEGLTGLCLFPRRFGKRLMNIW